MEPQICFGGRLRIGPFLSRQALKPRISAVVDLSLLKTPNSSFYLPKFPGANATGVTGKNAPLREFGPGVEVVARSQSGAVLFIAGSGTRTYQAAL